MDLQEGRGEPPGGASAGWLRQKLVSAGPALVLAALALVLTTRGIGDGGFRSSDASRHALDGVFIRDVVADLPGSILHPMDYVLRYYAKYPSLGIVLYYPPFFAMVEAAFFAVFGISAFTARLTVVAFAVVAAVMMYKLVKAMTAPAAAFLSTALFLSLPTVVFWSRQVMLEMPTTAMILTATYFFYKYAELGQRPSALWAAIFSVLAVMTKQPALFILPAFLLHLVIRRRWECWKHWQLWVGTVIIATVLIPYFWLSFRHAHYLIRMIGGGPAVMWHKFHSVLTGWRESMGLPLLIAFALAGTACAAWQWVRPRVAGTWLLLVLLVTFFMESVYLGAGVVRYVFIALPFFASLIPLLLHRTGLLSRRWVVAVLILPVLVLAGVSYAHRVPVKRGHGEAARALVERSSPNGIVLFDGYWDGDVVFFTRQHDPSRRVRLLRGSKMLYTYASFDQIGYQDRLTTREEIWKFIEDYGISAIAVEDNPRYVRNKLPARLLREFLQADERFELVWSRDVTDLGEDLNGVKILLYAVRNPRRLTARELLIPMTGLEMMIRVPLDDQGEASIVHMPRDKPK